MQFIAILPHQTMHRDNFGLKSGFVSSGTKGSSGPRSQLPTCRAGIQLNLPTTGEESKEENAIFLVQNAIFLPTTHLKSHNHFSPLQAMSNQRRFRGLRNLFPKILEVGICYFNLSWQACSCHSQLRRWHCLNQSCSHHKGWIFGEIPKFRKIIRFGSLTRS